MTTPAFVQVAHTSTTSGTNTQTCAFGSNLALNSHRFVCLRLSGGSNVVTSCVGSTSGAYTLLVSQLNTAAGMRLYVFYKEAGAAGAETVTVTTSTTGNSMRWGLLEYSGCLASASLDTWTSGTFTTTTTPVTASRTTTAVNDLMLAFIATDADVTTIVPGGTETSRFTDGVSGNRFEAQDYIKATAGATTSSWTLGASQPGVYVFAAFFADTGGGLPTPGPQQYQQRRSTIITL